MKNILRNSVLIVLLFGVIAVLSLQMTADDGDYYIYDLGKLESIQSIKNIATVDKITGENGAVIQRFISDGTNKNAHIE